VQDLTPAIDLLHGKESAAYADSSYQGFKKHSEKEGKGMVFQVALRPRWCRTLPDTLEGWIEDLVEATRLTSAQKLNIHSDSLSTNLDFKNPTKRHGQKTLQGEYIYSTHVPIHGPLSVAMQEMIKGMVELLKAKLCSIA